MKSHRPLRVASLIREELGQILLREMEFPGALVTITEVIIDDKLDLARVRVSVIPSFKSDDVFHGLRKAQGYLQHLLSYKINIRPMPFIRFEIDEGLGKAARIEKILIDTESMGEEKKPLKKKTAKKKTPIKKAVKKTAKRK